MRSFALTIFIVACSRPLGPTPAPAPPALAAPASAPAATARTAVAPGVHTGFEFKVRGDFFDGLRGDTAALDRAIKVCEDTLAREPNHPEAMVWHGAAIFGRSSLAFRNGDPATGRKLYAQGLDEMDRAVALAPRSIGVRIPRGAVVLAAAALVPEPERSRLVQRGVGDYEVTLAAQTPYFDTLTLHAREQLLYGLTDGYARLGDAAKAQAYYQRMTTAAAGSQLLDRAKARASGEPVAGATPCEQCHAR